MNIKSIIAIALAAGAIFGIGFGLLSKSDQQVGHQEPVVSQLDPNDPNRVSEDGPAQTLTQTPVKAPTEAPDFDVRKLELPVKQPEAETMTMAQANELIAAKEKEMQLLISDYNEALDDPKKKEALERKFKLQSKEYKKALLAKVKNGEL